MTRPRKIKTITFASDASFNPSETERGVWADGGDLTVSFQGRVTADARAKDNTVLYGSGDPGFIDIRFSKAVSKVSFQPGAFDLAGLGLEAMIDVRVYGANGWIVDRETFTVEEGLNDRLTWTYGENVVSSVLITGTGGASRKIGIDNVRVSLLPEFEPQEASGTAHIDGLLATRKWAGSVIDWSFATATSPRPGYGTGPETFDTSRARVETQEPLSGAQKKAVLRALEAWSDVADIEFRKVADGDAPGTIRFSRAQLGTKAAADGFYPDDTAQAGDVTIDLETEKKAPAGSWTNKVILHEIGHALGLSHPHEAVGVGTMLDPKLDSIATAVMSYRAYPEREPDGVHQPTDASYPTTPMIYDIAAVQHLYGPNWKTNAGNTTYTFDPREFHLFQTIWDGGGRDTYDASAYRTNARINLQPGAWSTFDPAQKGVLDYVAGKPVLAPGSVANALLYKDRERSLIENVEAGSGNDVIIGNKIRNRIEGNGGDDRIAGLRGNDKLLGGNGRDILDGGNGSDVLVGGSGADRLIGGQKADRFQYETASDSRRGKSDTIEDFGKGADTLVLVEIDANDGRRGNQDFDFIGAAAFDGRAGELRAVERGATTVLLGDLDGDGRAEFVLNLLGVTDLTADSLVL